MELSKICLALLLLVGLLATSGDGKPFSNIQSHDDKNNTAIEKEVKSIDYEGPENEVSTKSQMDEIKVIPTPYRRHIDDWTIIIIVIYLVIIFIVVLILYFCCDLGLLCERQRRYWTGPRPFNVAAIL